MKTSKPFSTISYNTDDFLYNKLSELVERNVLSFWCFIKHLPDTDQTKPHIHLIMFPNGQINTDSIRDELREIDLINPEKKALCCMPCTSSKFADWYLYGLHNKAYLLSKHQARKHHYSPDDMVCSEPDYLNELCGQIDYSKFDKNYQVVRGIEQGLSAYDMLQNGIIGLRDIVPVNSLINGLAYRNNRLNPVPPENDAELATQAIKEELKQIDDFKNAIDKMELEQKI